MASRIFSIMEVAQICNVDKHTASRWFNRGRIKGHRTPGNLGRCVPRDSLVEFLNRENRPLSCLEEYEKHHQETQPVGK